MSTVSKWPVSSNGVSSDVPSFPTAADIPANFEGVARVGGDLYVDANGALKLIGNDIITYLRHRFANNPALNSKVMDRPARYWHQNTGVAPGSWVDDLGAAVPLASPVYVDFYQSGTNGSVVFNPKVNCPTSNNVAVQFGADPGGHTFTMLSPYWPITTGSASVVAYKFSTDAQYFGVATAAGTGIYLLCDGERINDSKLSNYGGGGSGYWITVKHKSRKMREYTLLSGGYIGGLAVGPYDTVTPAPSSPVKMYADGDSYTPYESYYGLPGAFPGELSIALGLDYIHAGMGGTGYVTVNGAYPNLLSRINHATSAFNGTANMYLIMMGINDKTQNVTVNATAYYAQLRAAKPNALFIVVGPWTPNSADVTPYYAPMRDVIFTAVRAAGGPYILLDNINDSFETSWGTTGAASGTRWQNGDPFTGSAVGGSISSISRAANVMTVNTAASHGLSAGDIVHVDRISPEYDGRYTVLAGGLTATAFTVSSFGDDGTPDAFQGAVIKQTTAGSGNMNLYGDGGGTHPRIHGVYYLAQRIYNLLRAAVMSYPIV